MRWSREKNDSVTDMHHDSKEVEVLDDALPTPRGFDITRPQTYDIKSTRTDWVYKGAYSLRVHGTDNEIWNVQISTKALEIFRYGGTLVGTVHLSSWTSKVPIAMHNTRTSPEFTIARDGHGFKGLMGEQKSFTVHGLKLTWQRASKMSSTFELVDENKNRLAHIGPSSWKGRYQLVIEQGGMNPELVEICMVTALATQENEKRRVYAATVSASNSASAGAAAAVA